MNRRAIGAGGVSVNNSSNRAHALAAQDRGAAARADKYTDHSTTTGFKPQGKSAGPQGDAGPGGGGGGGGKNGKNGLNPREIQSFSYTTTLSGAPTRAVYC